MGKRVSAAPEDQSTGGFMDDVDVEVTGVEAVNDFDYGGTRQAKVSALKVTYAYEEGGETRTRDEHYTCGDKLQATEDGTGFESVDEDKEITGPGVMTKVGVYTRELCNAGFDGKVLRDGDYTTIIGTKGHVKQIPFKTQSNDKGKIVVFTKVFSQVKAGKAAGKAAPAKGKVQATVPDVDEDADVADVDANTERLQKIVRKVIKDAGVPVSKAKLSQLVDKKLQAANVEEDERNELVTAVLSEKFLKAVPGTSFDGRQISLDEA